MKAENNFETQQLEFMDNLQILLVEDDRSAAIDVEMLLEEMKLKLAAVKDNAADSLDYIFKHEPDLIIMDVELKGEKTGLEIAQEIEHLRIPVIFTTSYSDTKSFEQSKLANTYGYLVKPFNKISLQSMIEQTLKALQPDSELDMQTPGTVSLLPGTVLVRHLSVLYPIRFDEILYIQGEGNYCSLHTENRKFILKLSLRKLLESVPPTEFAPIHKSFIVRLDKVTAIDVGSGKLTAGKEDLPLGRNFKNGLLERFNILK